MDGSTLYPHAPSHRTSPDLINYHHRGAVVSYASSDISRRCGTLSRRALRLTPRRFGQFIDCLIGRYSHRLSTHPTQPGGDHTTLLSGPVFPIPHPHHCCTALFIVHAVRRHPAHLLLPFLGTIAPARQWPPSRMQALKGSTRHAQSPYFFYILPSCFAPPPPSTLVP